MTPVKEVLLYTILIKFCLCIQYLVLNFFIVLIIMIDYINNHECMEIKVIGKNCISELSCDISVNVIRENISLNKFI